MEHRGGCGATSRRRPAVHQRAHRPVPPAQGLRQARHQLACPAGPRPAERPGQCPEPL